MIDLPNDQEASGRSFGEEELEFLRQALNSGTLTATKGSFTPRFEREFAELVGVRHAIACSSGTAAIHSALAVLDLEPGDEVVTTAITDMGALTPILYQGLIPVFADVDPDTGNVTAETISAALSERTRAVIVTHLFGNPVDTDAVRALLAGRDITLVEDAAQSFLATLSDRYVGTLGDIACFSLQQGKHITSGEGGIVVTNDDDLAHETRLFVNKSWPYGVANPDHRKLGLNYRITELQSAVLTAQLKKLADFVAHRQKLAAGLGAVIDDLPGLRSPVVRDNDRSAFWRYTILVDEAVLPGGVSGLAAGLRERGVAAAPRYIGKPAFRCGIFADRKTFGTSSWPLSLARPEALDYSAERFPGTFSYLDRVVVIPWNERFETEHVDYLGSAIRDIVSALQAKS